MLKLDSPLSKYKFDQFVVLHQKYFNIPVSIYACVSNNSRKIFCKLIGLFVGYRYGCIVFDHDWFILMADKGLWILEIWLFDMCK